jgi:hypothetical protein
MRLSEDAVVVSESLSAPLGGVDVVCHLAGLTCAELNETSNFSVTGLVKFLYQ